MRLTPHQQFCTERDHLLRGKKKNHKKNPTAFSIKNCPSASSRKLKLPTAGGNRVVYLQLRWSLQIKDCLAPGQQWIRLLYSHLSILLSNSPFYFIHLFHILSGQNYLLTLHNAKACRPLLTWLSSAVLLHGNTRLSENRKYRWVRAKEIPCCE